ncbi:hypothetical protein MMC21_007296 [Puttea exsequens]|nr:hypothetical protein [Puttea exsequens]
MIRRKPGTKSSYLATPPPETSPRSSVFHSDWDADDEGTHSMEDVRPTRPLSIAFADGGVQKAEQYYPQRPTLPDVLSNSAPPPWTLSAFTAYLSQNHCLENLEFTMDAERYRERYTKLAAQMGGKPITRDGEEGKTLRNLWKRLIDAYIIPDGPREINIPSNVRETLLSQPNQNSPPKPDYLDSAVKIIYNLMEESVLVSFLNEVPPTNKAKSRQSASSTKSRRRGNSDSSNDKKPARSKSRRGKSPTASVEGSHSGDRSDPTGRLTPIPGYTRSHRATSHTSSGSVEPESLTDDSTNASSPGREPMTPPNSPPQSDFGGHSPRNRQENNWKKMLGWKKKSNTGMRDSRYPTLED